MQNDLEDLQKKIKALEEELLGNKWIEFPKKELIKAQLVAMTEYANLLEVRIEMEEK